MILDTDILIELLREKPEAQVWFDGLPVMPAVCGFSALELLQGCNNLTEMRRVERFLATFAMVWPDYAALSRTTSDYARLRLSHGLGLLDSLIATTAVHHARPLASFNVRHFRSVPSLVVVEPYVR
jgi:predicted nucleic acid-binding protein